MNKYMYSSTDLNYVEGYSSLLCRFLETRLLIQVYISLNREASLILLYKYIYIYMFEYSSSSFSQSTAKHAFINLFFFTCWIYSFVCFVTTAGISADGHLEPPLQRAVEIPIE